MRFKSSIILFIFILAAVFSCERDQEEKDMYFEPEKLESLELAETCDFWDNSINIDTSYSTDSNFENHSGFLECISLHDGTGKDITISAFQSGDEAVNAMITRVNDVACLITDGDQELFNATWWFMDCVGYAIFVNQHNTIIEIRMHSSATAELVQGILIEVAEELMDRIDDLSVSLK